MVQNEAETGQNEADAAHNKNKTEQNQAGKSCNDDQTAYNGIGKTQNEAETIVEDEQRIKLNKIPSYGCDYRNIRRLLTLNLTSNDLEYRTLVNGKSISTMSAINL